MIRVFVLDDHQVVRDGVRAIAGDAGDMQVVGEAATADRALAGIRACSPDVAIVDLHPGDADGVDVCRQVHLECPDVHCLIFTSISSDGARIQARDAGAAGYVLKQSTTDELVQAIRDVAAGRQLLDDAAIRLAARRRRDSDEGHVDVLTPQEHRIFVLIRDGLTNREIADRLVLSDKTVKNYVSNLLAKLGVERRAEAAALAGRIEAHCDVA